MKIRTGGLLAIVMAHVGASSALGAIPPVVDQLSVPVELGPITGAANDRKIVTFNLMSRRKVSWYDVQDGLEHNVRGVSLQDLLARAKVPRAADTVLFEYSDGMQIPVRLADTKEVSAIFVALEHGNVKDEFGSTYPLHNAAAFTCPKVVYGRKIKAYSIWIYPTQLTTIRVVTWKPYEAILAQATRGMPDRSGWGLYVRHCQSCHGIGGQGAKRGPDFLSDMEAYRRVPPFAVTDVGDHPSLHEKVKGFVDGTMPVLNHIPNADIARLWRWLHAIHDGATK